MALHLRGKCSYTELNLTSFISDGNPSYTHHIHSPVEVCLDCFQFLVVMNRFPMHVYVNGSVLISLGQIFSVLGHMVNECLSFSFFFFFKDTRLLCSPGWPRSHSVDKVDLKEIQPAPAS